MIGADLVPTKSNYQYFKEGDAKSLIGKRLLEKLRSADFTIFNLEIPLVEKCTPIIKCGPNLAAPTYTINGLKAINRHFFTLANNHILDQGELGLESTINILNKADIAYAGSGRNLEEAIKPYLIEIKGIKLGIYCCTEHEFSIADNSKAGANPFDPLESFDHVMELKNKCDYLIVLYHGGKEHYRYPSPQLRKVCRKFIEKGADLIICQHSHCIGTEEQWKNGYIIYGQGNFLFDYGESDYWQTSLLIDVSLEKKNREIVTKIQYHPLRKNKEKVRLAEQDDAEIILQEFYKRSEEMKQPEKLIEYYQKFADSMLENYLNTFMGKESRNIFYRIINKGSGYRFSKWRIKRKYKEVDRLAIQNYIECEAHRELLLKGIANRRNI